MKKKKKAEQGTESEVLEKQLFHGTLPEYVESICKQGFDFRLSGSTVGK